MGIDAKTEDENGQCIEGSGDPKELNNCRECKQTINVGATKCHHCGAYQNWLRFLGTSALLAGFVLTWVSIWAAPPIKQMLEAKRADIKVSILDGDFSHMTFMISNTGNQPAGLAQIEIESKLKHGSGSWYLYSDLDKKLIEPGKAYVSNVRTSLTRKCQDIADS
jgi:hypothetical protein